MEDYEEEIDEYENELDDEDQNEFLEEPAAEIDENLEEVMEDIESETEEEGEKQVISDVKNIGKEILNKSISKDNHKILTVVPDNERITSHIIQQYEFANIISIRSSQIERGSPIFIKIDGLSNAKDIAIAEFTQKKCPLIIERRVGDSVEHWKAREMVFLGNI